MTMTITNTLHSDCSLLSEQEDANDDDDGGGDGEVSMSSSSSSACLFTLVRGNHVKDLELALIRQRLLSSPQQQQQRGDNDDNNIDEKKRIQTKIRQNGTDTAFSVNSTTTTTCCTPTPTDTNGDTLLHTAIREGNILILTLLLEHDVTAKNLNTPNPLTGDTPLHTAVLFPTCSQNTTATTTTTTNIQQSRKYDEEVTERQAGEICELLLRHGANPNVINTITKASVLEYAVETCRSDIAVLLLEYGANVEVEREDENDTIDKYRLLRPHHHRPLLHLAVEQYLCRRESWGFTEYRQRQRILEVLLPTLLIRYRGHGHDHSGVANISLLKVPLERAALCGEDELMELLLSATESSYGSQAISSGEGTDDADSTNYGILSTALDNAVQNGHIRCVQLLLNHHGSNREATTTTTTTTSETLDVNNNNDNRTEIVLKTLANSKDGTVKMERDEMTGQIIKLTMKRYTGELPEIFQIRSLQSLTLNEVDYEFDDDDNNDMTNNIIPASSLNRIYNLQNLTFFQIGYSESPNLTHLPPELGQLSNLKSISISNCPRLIGLPVELANLPRLEKLFLWECKLIRRIPTRSLPPSLKHLTIKRCDITSLLDDDDDDDNEDNSIVSLPPGLCRLQLDKNPIMYSSNASQQQHYLESILERHEQLGLIVEDVPHFPYQRFPLISTKVLYLSVWNQIRGQYLLTNTTRMDVDNEVERRVAVPLACWSLLLASIRDKCPYVFEKETPELQASVMFTLMRSPTMLEHFQELQRGS